MAKKPPVEIEPEIAFEDPIDELQKARANARFAKHRFDEDSAPSMLAAANVDQSFWPTRSQYKKLWLYVIPDMGLTPEGWWYAYCPAHDPNMQGGVSALFNFTAGSMRCTGDQSCHPDKKAMTFVNALIAAHRKLTGDDV